jgi:hypothetical protein
MLGHMRSSITDHNTHKAATRRNRRWGAILVVMAALVTAFAVAAQAGPPVVPRLPGPPPILAPIPNPGYVGPTPNITKVANAIYVRAKSLQIAVHANPGLVLTQPVNVIVQFNSPDFRGLSQNAGLYDSSRGLNVGFMDDIKDGLPRPVTVTITLRENQYSFTIPGPNTIIVTPLFNATISQGKFTLDQDCDIVGDSEIHFGWRAPDGSWHEKGFSMSANQSRDVPEFNWWVNELSQQAIQKFRYPTMGFWEHDPGDVGVASPFVQPGIYPIVLPAISPQTKFENLKDIAGDSSCFGHFTYSIQNSPVVIPNL